MCLLCFFLSAIPPLTPPWVAIPPLPPQPLLTLLCGGREKVQKKVANVSGVGLAREKKIFPLPIYIISAKLIFSSIPGEL